MDIELLRSFCLSFQGVSESFPFGEDTLVFKVGSKMFCLTNLSKSLQINVKCDPENGAILREEYLEISPGYHMNKKHWITVDLEGGLTQDLVKSLIRDSYELVRSRLTKKELLELKLDN